MNGKQAEEFPSIYQPPIFAKPTLIKAKGAVTVRNDKVASVIFDAARVVLQPGRPVADQCVVSFRIPFGDPKSAPEKVVVHFRLAVDKEAGAQATILLNVGQSTETLFFPTGGEEIHEEIFREVVVERSVTDGGDLPVIVVLAGKKRHKDAYCLVTLHSVDLGGGSL